MRVSTRAFVFFFSSRRRHTRCLSDWSSDVCSSDLCRAIARDDWLRRGPLVVFQRATRREPHRHVACPFTRAAAPHGGQPSIAKLTEGRNVRKCSRDLGHHELLAAHRGLNYRSAQHSLSNGEFHPGSSAAVPTVADGWGEMQCQCQGNQGAALVTCAHGWSVPPPGG